MENPKRLQMIQTCTYSALIIHTNNANKGLKNVTDAWICSLQLKPVLVLHAQLMQWNVNTKLVIILKCKSGQIPHTNKSWCFANLDHIYHGCLL